MNASHQPFAAGRPPAVEVPGASVPIRFDDGAAYERYMGLWSREVGLRFLDWLALPAGGRWLDIGCGNGAFTELLPDRVAPAAIDGIDPSAAQLAHARARPIGARARFVEGDAMALPYADGGFDAAVMPLVIFFVPDPARGVAEMRRVLRPGGTAAAYAWDMAGGGFPYHLAQQGLREAGVDVPRPPSPEASDLPALVGLWQGAGLVDVCTEVITVRRRWPDFEAWWQTLRDAPSMGARIAGLDAERSRQLKERLCARLQPEADGSLWLSARAHAVRGRVPG
ncbi:class I SAM-dependent methyltransferase [Pseudaquabacterium rugosum]|uniref:Class I SAM-dependent methyltransferase n=1 Tax=Pseudaquabacterium rugosum TaxID=2984194 RepID=A0ABU9B8J0_9BURK